MIEINKLNGSIKILEFWIEPYDNIEKIVNCNIKCDIFLKYLIINFV